MVDYDVVLGCYTFDYQGELFCLGAQTYDEAVNEANLIVEVWV